METKICEKCKTEKPIDEFGYLMGNRKLRNKYCKTCFQNIKKRKVSNRLEDEMINSLRYQSEIERMWDMIKPLDETHRVLDQLRETEKSQKNIWNMIKPSDESRKMWDMISPLDETQRIIDQIRETEESQKQMWDMIQPSDEIQRMMNEMDETQRMWDMIQPTGEIQRVMDTLKESGEIQRIRDMIQPSDEIQRMMNEMDETQRMLDTIIPSDEIQNLINEIKTNKHIFDNIDIQNDGSISFEGYNIKIEVNYIFNIYLKDILYNTNNSGKKLNKYPDKIKYIIVKLIKHIYDKYLVYIIQTILIIIVINNVSDNQMLSKSLKFLSNKEINNYYITNKNIVLNPNESLSDYKFVKKNNIKIYHKPKKDSQILGILTIGQLVKIIDKNKKYTLIEIYDEDTEETIKGWVLTKYIQPIKY